MGGFGAISYAARHPDLFSWAGSFSGAVDIVNYPPVAAIINLEAPFDGGLAGDQFGDRTLDEANWRAHNPWDLAANLRGMTLVITPETASRARSTRRAGPSAGQPAPKVRDEIRRERDQAGPAQSDRAAPGSTRRSALGASRRANERLRAGEIALA